MSYLSPEEVPEIESHREACETTPYEIDTREWTLNGFRQYISGPQLDGTEAVVVIPKSRLVTSKNTPSEIDTREWTLNGFRQYISGPQLDGTEVVIVIPKSRLATHEHGGGKDHTPPPAPLAI